MNNVGYLPHLQSACTASMLCVRVCVCRMDNLIFAVGKPEVVAVLDWELSTLGDPISDLAYCCMTYHLPASQPHLKGDPTWHACL